MPLNAYKTLFTPEWVQAVRGAPEAGMAACVRIYDLGSGRVYDEATNGYTYPNEVEFYAGKARVQPLQNARYIAQPNDSSSAQKVLISIPIGAVSDDDIRNGAQVRVTEAILNPALTKYQYVITDIMDSSNPIERTLMCQVIQETVV